MDAMAASLLFELQTLNSNIEVPPEGWKTARQWGETWNLQNARTNELIRKGIVRGVWEKKTFRIAKDSGPYPVWHYRRKP